MKKLFFKGVLILLTLFLAPTDMLGQKGRYGDTPEDSIRCIRNLALYADRHRQGNFEDALPYWRVIFAEFPRASRNIYIWGVDLMTHMIENAENEEEKKAYLDTAMIMFDQRVEYFGDAANVLGRKGTFYFAHNNNIEEAGPGYEALGEAIRLSGTDQSAAAIVTFMNVTVGKFRSGLVDNGNVIETYTYLMEVLEKAMERTSNDGLQQAKDYVEAMFAESGAADCDALIKLFADQVSSSPDDFDLLNKVNHLLTDARCTDSDLYLTITVKLHNLDPTPRSSLILSSMYRGRDDDEQVVKYLKQALDLQENPEERANYLLELAIIANQVKNNKTLSRDYALQALKENPALGRAHLLIGSLYASESNCFAGEEGADFKNSTVYWVAADRFNEAKKVDPSLTAEATRNIEVYSAYFPDNESIFFHGYTTGNSYRVGCWINETTTIRPR